MGARTSKVGYISVATRKGGPRSIYGHVVALEKTFSFDNTHFIHLQAIQITETFNFLQSIIATWQTYEVVRQEQ
jgi:hypothetical protein